MNFGTLLIFTENIHKSVFKRISIDKNCKIIIIINIYFYLRPLCWSCSCPKITDRMEASRKARPSKRTALKLKLKLKLKLYYNYKKLQFQGTSKLFVCLILIRSCMGFFLSEDVFYIHICLFWKIC